MQVGGDAVASREATRQEIQCGKEPHFIEQARAKLLPDMTQVLFEGGEMALDDEEAFAQGRLVAGSFGEGEVHRGEQLARFVVQGLPNRTSLPLEDGA